MKSEIALNEFNALIASAGKVQTKSFVPQMLFVCGAPRSGTTLASQALVHGGNLGCINNLVARFITNPPLGVRLTQALELRSEYHGMSNYGRTTNLTEPHEFGQGWLNILGLDGLTQPDASKQLKVQSVEDIMLIGAAWEKPVVFKSFAYLWFIEELAAALPNSLWLHIRRDFDDNAASLSRLYRARGHSDDTKLWVSAVCRDTVAADTDNQPLAARCLRQVQDIDKHITSSFVTLPEKRRLTVRYEDFASNPRKATKYVLSHFSLPQASEQLSEIPE